MTRDNNQANADDTNGVSSVGHATAQTGVCVVNYFSGESVRNCLSSLRTVRRREGISLVIVDNSANADETAILERLSDEYSDETMSVMVLPQEDNLGFARANNLGAEALIAQGVEILVFTNPDVVFLSADFEAIRGQLHREPEFIFGARTIEGGSAFTGLSRVSALTGRGRPIREPERMRERRRQIVYPDGHLIAITVDVWQKTGGFSEDFFLYYEEPDLAMRAARMGIGVRRLAKLLVQHERGVATLSGNPMSARSIVAIYHSARSSVIFAAKHRPRRSLVLVVALRLGAALMLVARGQIARASGVLKGTAAGLQWIAKRGRAQ